MKDCGTHYSYIAHYVDDVLCFNKTYFIVPKFKTYMVKGVGKLEYYLGGDVIDLDGTYKKRGYRDIC